MDSAPPPVHAGQAVGNDQSAEIGRLGCSPSSGQHTAPGVTVEIDRAAGEIQVREEVVELGDEERFGPEGFVAVLVGQVGGAAVTKLIVEDDGYGV